MRNLTSHNQAPQLLATKAARRLAYDYQLERGERLQQMSADIDRSLALYFTGVRHPAQDHGFEEWLQCLIDAEQGLSVWMADCIDKLTELQGDNA